MLLLASPSPCYSADTYVSPTTVAFSEKGDELFSMQAQLNVALWHQKSPTLTLPKSVHHPVPARHSTPIVSTCGSLASAALISC